MAKTRHPGSSQQTHLPTTVQAVTLAVAAVAGLLASFELLQSELKILGDPNAILSCDLNPLIACSSSLLSKQAHLLWGMPNSVFGLIAFTALLTLATLLISRVHLPNWIWWGLGAGTVGGLGYVGFFLWESVTVFRALCPYCMVIWAATIAASVLVWSNLLSRMTGPRPSAIGKALGRYWPLVVMAIYLLIVLIIVVGLRHQVAALFV